MYLNRCLLCKTTVNPISTMYTDAKELTMGNKCLQCTRRTETFGSFLSDIYDELKKFTKTNKSDKQ